MKIKCGRLFYLALLYLIIPFQWLSAEPIKAYDDVHFHRIAVIGTGYVGLVAGACLADLGHTVVCCDVDRKKIESLNSGVVPIHEIGLKEIIDSNQKKKRLFFSNEIGKAIQESDTVFICVGTPSDVNGQADLTYIYNVCENIRENINNPKVVFVKSTVPVGTVAKLERFINAHTLEKKKIEVAFTPEFLREGSSVQDFQSPERLVLGTDSEKAKRYFSEIFYRHFTQKIPFLFTSIESAEMIKYASNCFLAVKLSFINEIANLCDKNGADIVEVTKGMGLDSRIGPQFLLPGPGYGGSCFPKDSQALLHEAKFAEVELKVLRAAVEANSRQPQIVLDKLKKLLQKSLKGKTIAILGLAFKANTDDIRYSPACLIIDELLSEGAHIKVYDPVAMANAQITYPNIVFSSSPDEAVKDADALIIATDWKQFLEMDLTKIQHSMKSPIFVDARNLFSPEKLKQVGFQYENMGHKKEFSETNLHE